MEKNWSTVQLHCRECNARMMDYTLCQDDDRIVLPGHYDQMQSLQTGNDVEEIYRRHDTEACRQRCVPYLTDLGSVT